MISARSSVLSALISGSDHDTGDLFSTDSALKITPPLYQLSAVSVADGTHVRRMRCEILISESRRRALRHVFDNLYPKNQLIWVVAHTDRWLGESISAACACTVYEIFPR